MAHCRNVLNSILIFEKNVVDAINRAKQAKRINNKTVGFVDENPKKAKAGFGTTQSVSGKIDQTMLARNVKKL